MSLSSFLLGGAAKDKLIDDGLFASTVKASAEPKRPAAKSTAAAENASSSSAKRKLPEEVNTPSSSKRTKTKRGSVPFTADEKPKKEKKIKKVVIDAPEDEAETSKKALKPASSKKAAKTVEETVQPISDDEISGDEDIDPSKLVHESLLEGGKSKNRARKATTKVKPEDETNEQRDARTIFVGNVAVEVAKNRPLLKQLKKHILSFVPSAKIESVRLRSVAFQKPTAPPAEGEDGKDTKGKQKEVESEPRQHDRDRIASWRAAQGGDDDGVAVLEKKFLTPAEKKRVAFFKSEIHSGIDSVNAYVVFAHPVPDAGTRPANLPPLVPTMDPYEAAKLAAAKCDGTSFLERTLRADVARTDIATTAGKSGEISGDPKLTVFVGNLDFASKEEDLRVFFEGLMSVERGPPSANQDHDSEVEDDDDAEGQPTIRPSSWVKRVRIIRDKDTLLGKGFAYVQFADRECVDEILSMEELRLKFAKRKLRVQRCKTLPGAKTKIPPSRKNAPPPNPQAAASSRRVPSAPVPKGDPNLGAKISHLSKEERKDVKKGDADRVTRRLAKKVAKSKMALIEKGVKSKISDRERSRKRPNDYKSKAGGDKKKGRVRSEKAISKLNTKK
ncbi:hypothetical protein EUX98_g5066 [Antrodiella citrinella]|uniref:Nucleolar protein 12 n=1 Tax=Antrodiella citrinella TaxID=2447956 RepID=A0A4S4MUA4_9APHY|nr:hypothetical protein EUX98_g5066 [Antrodiella citrinella]